MAAATASVASAPNTATTDTEDPASTQHSPSSTADADVKIAAITYALIDATREMHHKQRLSYLILPEKGRADRQECGLSG